MKNLVLSFLFLGFLPVALHAAFSNDFSAAPTITDPNSTSPWIGPLMPGSGSYTFLEDFADLTHDAVNENLDISGTANTWLLINTQTWSPGDFTVTFDGQVTSGDTMYWDVIGGNISNSSLGVRIWMNQNRPYIRATSGGTAERLGQINPAGDTAGAATASVAAGSFTDTTLTSQSLDITLTADHVGSANDYLLIGWNNTGGNGDATIDNISVVIPEPSSIALVGIAGLAFYVLKRRKF